MLETSNPFSRSHVVPTPAKLLQWLTPRAGGFDTVNLILDVEIPWENEVAMDGRLQCVCTHPCFPKVVACRRALWFVMTNTVLPILGLLSATLKEVLTSHLLIFINTHTQVVVTVADMPDVPLSEHAALYSAPSAVSCLAHALGGLPKLDFLMLDCLWLQVTMVTCVSAACQPPHTRVRMPPFLCLPPSRTFGWSSCVAACSGASRSCRACIASKAST